MDDFYLLRIEYLELDQAQFAMRLMHGIPESMTLQIWPYWVEDFTWKIKRFQQTWCYYHESVVHRAFLRERKLPDDWEPSDPSEYELHEDYDAYREKCGIPLHYKFVDEECDLANSYLKKYLPNRPKGWSSAELVKEIIQQDIDVRVPLSLLNEVWFDWFIHSSVEQQRNVQALPYDEYLKSDHWQRVRLARLLILNRGCQVIKCNWNYPDGLPDDSLWEIHIHHLNYKNIGRERYRDLVVLCNRHHEQWHKEGKAKGKSKLDIEDPDSYVMPEHWIETRRGLLG